MWEKRSHFIRFKDSIEVRKSHRKFSEIFSIKHWYDDDDDDVCSDAFPRKNQFETTNNEGNANTKCHFCILQNYYCYALVDYKIINRLESGLSMVSITYTYEYDIVNISFVCPPQNMIVVSNRFVSFASAVSTHTHKYVCKANSNIEKISKKHRSTIISYSFHISLIHLLSLCAITYHIYKYKHTYSCILNEWKWECHL